MPRGGARPGAGRPKKQPTTTPKTAKAPPAPANPAQVDGEGYKTNPEWPFGQERPPEAPKPADLSALTPLDYMLEVMRNPDEEPATRRQMAIQAAPYCHAKKGEMSAKRQEAEDRKKAVSSGKFARRPPPAGQTVALVASGGKEI